MPPRAQHTLIDSHLNVALAQYLNNRDPAIIVGEAKNAGGEIVLFPEMFSNGHALTREIRLRGSWLKEAQSPNGSFVERFREAARTYQTYVAATFLQAADPKPFDSALTAAGAVKLGLMICMDREYPEAARSLSRAGAEIALVPNCCPLVADDVVGDVRIAQMRGRASETVIGIAVANYPAPRCDGHSFAVDATGAIIAMADDSPGLTIAAFDLSLIRKARTKEHFRWQV